MKRGITIDQQKCRRCKMCMRACPKKAIEMTEHGARITEKCIACGQCTYVCPVEAISFTDDNILP